VQYLKAKIDFHRLYPLFNGVFDFDEYVKNKAIDNLDEAYQTISDLSSLMNHLDKLSCSIINQFRGFADANECRQAALIPLVLESHGMYKFMTNLLSVLLESTLSPTNHPL
jgi:huntingtin-interacting protein 1-related protein